MSAGVLIPRDQVSSEAVRQLAMRYMLARQATAPAADVLLAARQFRQDYALQQFVREAWPYIEPQPYVDGWHIQALCTHLQAVTETAAATDAVPSEAPPIRNLLVNIPPRMSKSIISSVLWPAWVWLSWPACRWLYASYSKDLALRDAVYARALMATPWYEALKQTPWVMVTDQRVKSFYANSAQGYRISTSVSGMATGTGADIRCLPGDQRILTEHGELPIREIVEQRLPIKVASYAHKAQQIEWRRILAWHDTKESEVLLWTLVTDRHVLRLTEQHPVYVQGRGYVAAENVQMGDRLFAPTLARMDPAALVTGVYTREVPEAVYNLTVEGNNNYFAEGVLVHNCGDDLHSVQEDLSTTRAEIVAAKQFWLMTMATRTTDAKRSCQVLVGQRVALDDVSAEVLKQGDYAYLKIPMEYEPEHAAPATPLGWVDPRTEDSELLCPERFGIDEVQSLKRRLGHRYFTQCQQRPVSELTSIFPRSAWQHFYVWPDVQWFDVLIQSWDFRFGEDKQSGSYVAGHLWGRKGPPETGNVFLLDRVFERLSFGESVKAMRGMSEKWPGAYAKLIEQAANGHAIYSTLRSQVFGLVLVPVGGKYSSKRARAEAEAFVLEQKRAWLPHPTIAPWVEAYMTHMEQFPADPTDDTDATSQAWAHLCPPPPAKDTVREAQAKRHALERQIHMAQQRTERRSGRKRRTIPLARVSA